MLAAAVLLSGVSQAAITYIDATASNTTGVPPADGTTVNGWRGRGLGLGQGTSNFGNEGGVYEAGGNEAATSTLTTTLTLTNGFHDIYVFFWDDEAGGAWDIKAGISGSTLTGYSSTTGAFKVDAASQAVPATQVNGLNVLGQGADDYTDYVDGNRELYAAHLGTFEVTTGSISIDIDANDASGQRTWFDGVGVPEPSSALLCGLGAIGFLRRRR